MNHAESMEIYFAALIHKAKAECAAQVDSVLDKGNKWNIPF